MKIYMQKIGMIRPNFNPKNKKLNLDLDWSVDYRDTDQKFIKYDCILRTYEDFALNFKVEGVLKLQESEKFLKEEVSQIIFDKAFEILMKMVSLTRESSYSIKDSDVNIADYLNDEIMKNHLMN